MAIDPKSPAKDKWQTVIAEKPEVLNGAGTAAGYIFCNYLKDANTKIFQHKLDGTLVREIELPALGTAGGFGGKRDEKILFYTFTSFTYPPTIYKFDPATGASEVFRKSEVKFDPAAYETKQIFYASKDGTKVPMFIVHKKGLALDGQNPTFLTAYGGFNISNTPAFSAANIILLENGGVYALANLRGGGEYGEAWHKAGMLDKKQNVFDDFIAAAEYLIKEKYTSTPRLAIEGASNGGLLIGAVMTQRPELFGVAFPGVGVMDMLRYHKFTVGWGWAVEYGSSDSEDAVPVPVQVLAPAQPEARRLLPGDHGDDGRPRRPRLPGPLVQVRGDAAGRSGVRQADRHPDRDPVRPRLEQPEQGHRRPDRPVVLHVLQHGAHADL